MFDLIGWKCVCCGETERAFLHFDHINDDGHIERKKVGRGPTLWAYMLKQPDAKSRYQTLCANCNTAKSKMDICPHKLAGEQWPGLVG